jgi:hypothetical protein
MRHYVAKVKNWIEYLEDNLPATSSAALYPKHAFTRRQQYPGYTETAIYPGKPTCLHFSVMYTSGKNGRSNMYTKVYTKMTLTSGKLLIST